MCTIVLGSGSVSPGQTCCPVCCCAVKAHSEPCVAASGLEGKGQVGLGVRWGGWGSQVGIQVLGPGCRQGAVWHGMVVSLKDWSGLQRGSLAEAGTFWCLPLLRRDCDNPFPFMNHVFLVVLCDHAQSCCHRLVTCHAHFSFVAAPRENLRLVVDTGSWWVPAWMQQ